MYHILFSFLWTRALKYLVDPGLSYFELASEEERERERERRERRERGRREGERGREGEEAR